ncbi:MAG TPA: TonB-dependent receptor, partial [Pseudomonadaceae bacterium]|nr:TonB-dependent receptor [Pseudomonadaceae bacterium]
AREIYTEFLIPVATGIELGGHRVMDELNLEAGYRYSDMEPSGSINTWKILFDWKINDFARLRGGKQVANRAPNIAELYQSPTQGFGFSFIGDLCSENNTHVNSAAPANPNGASVRAMCETLMGPTGSMVYYDPQRDQPTGPGFGFAFANTIGNANLENESADTVTFGGVFNLTDRTTLTVDWYQIDIQNMIALQAADSVFLRCFDPAVNTGMSLDFYECQKIARDPSNGSQAPIDITYSNQAQAKVSGVDVQLNWGTDFWNGGLNVNFMASFTDEVETRQTPTSAPTDWKGTSGIDVSGMNGGWYDYRTFTTFTYFDNAGWNASLTWRFLPPISSGAAATGETTVQDTRNYSVFDFSTGYRFGEDDRYQVSLNINNLLNEPPEFTGKDYADGTSRTTGLGTTSSGFYDVIGRQYSLRLNIDF